MKSNIFNDWQKLVIQDNENYNFVCNCCVFWLCSGGISLLSKMQTPVCCWGSSVFDFWLHKVLVCFHLWWFLAGFMTPFVIKMRWCQLVHGQQDSQIPISLYLAESVDISEAGIGIRTARLFFSKLLLWHQEKPDLWSKMYSCTPKLAVHSHSSDCPVLILTSACEGGVWNSKMCPVVQPYSAFDWLIKVTNDSRVELWVWV